MQGRVQQANGHRIDPFPDNFEFVDVIHQRDHDFRQNFVSLFDQLARRFDDGMHLHFINLGKHNTQSAPAQSQHGILLFQGIDLLRQFGGRSAHLFGEGTDFLRSTGKKLVQGRVQQANGHRQAVHYFKNLGEVGPLNRQKSFDSLFPHLCLVGNNHFAHQQDAFLVEEHVLGAAQADALRAEFPRNRRIVRRISVGADVEPAHLVRPSHQLPEIAGNARLRQWHLALYHLPRRSVESDEVEFLEDYSVERSSFLARFHLQFAQTGNAGFAHGAGDHRRVRRHAPPGRQNALRHTHAVDILR